MNYINAIIFGLVQGITEFLPISSSGHLVILHNFISLPIKDELAFDVFLHLATLIAVVWFFRKLVLRLLKSWLKSFSGKKDELTNLSWLIVLATIPAFLAGWLTEDIISTIFRSVWYVAVMLVTVGLLFLFIEKISLQTKDIMHLNWRKAMLIGLAQAIALIPGTSRSGITIIAGIALGLKREAAIKFSFLLSIPIIAGASIKKAPLLAGTDLIGNEWLIILVSFIASLISGMLTIKYFLRFSKNHNLNIFAIYRIALAVIIIIFLIAK